MRKKVTTLVLVAAAVLVAIVAGAALVYLSGQNSVRGVSIEGAEGTTTYNGATVPTYSFAPARTEVKRGVTVTWTNTDPIASHTITSVDGMIQSNLLQPKEQFSFKFDTDGTYPYYCRIHPWMKGEVVVVE